MINSSSNIGGAGTVTANAPVKIVTSGTSSISGSATLDLSKEFTRYRTVGPDQLYEGIGLVTVQAGARKIKMIQSDIQGSAKLEVLNYEKRDIMKDIKSYVPKYYQDSKHVQSILQTNGNESIRLHSSIYDVLDQFYIETATWGLDLWEELFGIETDYLVPIEIRREELILRFKGFYKVGVDTLLEQAEKFWESTVTQDPSNYTVTVQITQIRAVEESLDPKKFKRFVHRMKAMVPSHIELIIKFSYVPWQEVLDSDLRFSEVGLFSWHQFMTQYYKGPKYIFQDATTWEEVQSRIDEWNHIENSSLNTFTPDWNETNTWSTLSTDITDNSETMSSMSSMLWSDFLGDLDWSEVEVYSIAKDSWDNMDWDQADQETWEDIDSNVTNKWEVAI